MTLFIQDDVTDFDDDLWEAACREADRRDDIYVTPEDILREWNAEDSFDGYEQESYDLYDLISFDCD
jgi:hypothetical protein